VWTKQFGANGDDVAWGVAVDSTGNIVVNIVVLTSDTLDDFNLRKFSAVGALLQSRQ
jgi:Beta-propeller repeat